MSKIFLYAHGGSGNHGCEAIVRATVKILHEQELVLISARPDEDRIYGVDQLCSVIQDHEGHLNRFSPDFAAAYAALKLRKDFIPLEKLHYKRAFSLIQPGDIAMSIGGDNYCYADAYKYTMFHEMAKRRGAKTVLWGCSVEPEIVTRPEIAKDLTQYDLITARETISYEALLRVNPNTLLVCDPAFLLDKVELPCPAKFVPGNTVGINLSPMAMENESIPGMAYANYKNLIRYILENTDMNVLLIPHVIWQDNDDRQAMKPLLEEFMSSQRIILLEDHTCEELKGYISRCRFFVGARTHSTIAAYSSGIPTLVVGYSVKARGIAKDLFGSSDNYVIPVQRMTSNNQLSDAFYWIMKHEESIRNYLSDILPEYCAKAFVSLDKELK